MRGKVKNSIQAVMVTRIANHLNDVVRLAAHPRNRYHARCL